MATEKEVIWPLNRFTSLRLEAYLAAACRRLQVRVCSEFKGHYSILRAY